MKIVALPIFLGALQKAHDELVTLGIGYNGKLGFVLSNDLNGSWRSLTMQKQLVAKGASKTLYSNHRRGTAVDCAADWDYVERIAPTMKKYGLVNDLAYIKGNKTSDVKLSGYVGWDAGHWNYGSNSEAGKYPIINEQALIKEFSMTNFNECLIQLVESGVSESGAFALVIGGKKRLIPKERLAQALATVLIRKMKAEPVNKKQWDAISTGEIF